MTRRGHASAARGSG